MALDFLGTLADTLTRAGSEGLKGFRVFQEEQEEEQVKAKADAQARVKWRESLAGGPDKAFELWGDEYLKDAKLAYGFDIPTREEDVFGKGVTGERVMPRTAPEPGTVEAGVGPAAVLARHGAGERRPEAPFGFKTFPTFGPVKTGTKRVLALPGMKPPATLGDLFAQAKGTSIGSLPISDISTLNTATSVGKAMGWITDDNKVEVVFEGKKYTVSPSEALRFAQEQAKNKPGQTMSITIDGTRYDNLTSYQAASLMISHGNLQARRRTAARGGQDDAVLKRQVADELRAAEAAVAAAENRVRFLRPRALPDFDPSGAEIVDESAREELAKAETALAEARGRYQVAQAYASRAGLVKTVSRAEIKALAKANNMSEEDAERFFRAKGYTVTP